MMILSLIMHIKWFTNLIHIMVNISGLKCKECKYKCHRDCECKVPPSCGLPRELVDEFRKTLQQPDGKR